MSNNTTESSSSYFEQKITKEKKPTAVVVIFVLSCLSLAGILPTLMISSGLIPLNIEIKEFYYDFNNISEYFRLILLPASFFIASFFLFKLKKIAIKLFIGVIIIKILTIVYKFSMIEPYIKQFAESPTSVIVNQGTVVLVFIIALWYVKKLDKDGVLKP
jgi:hypothetical protein